jgi:hypothetical protein
VKDLLKLVTIAVVVIVGIVTVLAVVPITTGYQFGIAPCGGGNEVRQFPSGAFVVVHWYEPDSSTVIFEIQEGSQVLYSQTTNGGAYSFTSNGQEVTFAADSTEYYCTASPVSVYGHWNSPYLVL